MARRKRQNYVEGKYYRVNEDIRAPKIRVVLPGEGQIGVLTRKNALKKAKAKELDLVEVAPGANPPVAKLIDFAKFKYDQAKKKKSSKGSSPETKQLRLRPFMEEHDLNVRIKKIKNFLDKGDRVKIQIRFYGREMTKKKYGYEMIDKIMEKIKKIGKLNRKPAMKGNVLETLIVPK